MSLYNSLVVAQRETKAMTKIYMRPQEDLGEQENERDVPEDPPTDSEVPQLILDDPANDKEDPTLEDWTHKEVRFQEMTYQCQRSLYTKRDMAEPMEEGERVEKPQDASTSENIRK